MAAHELHGVSPSYEALCRAVARDALATYWPHCPSRWLASLVWPEQVDRAERLDRALDLVAADRLAGDGHRPGRRVHRTRGHPPALTRSWDRPAGDPPADTTSLMPKGAIVKTGRWRAVRSPTDVVWQPAGERRGRRCRPAAVLRR